MHIKQCFVWSDVLWYNELKYLINQHFIGEHMRETMRYRALLNLMRSKFFQMRVRNFWTGNYYMRSTMVTT